MEVMLGWVRKGVGRGGDGRITWADPGFCGRPDDHAYEAMTSFVPVPRSKFTLFMSQLAW